MKTIDNLAKFISIIILMTAASLVMGLILGHFMGEKTDFTMFLWALLTSILSAINLIALFSKNSPN